MINPSHVTFDPTLAFAFHCPNGRTTDLAHLAGRRRRASPHEKIQGGQQLRSQSGAPIGERSVGEPGKP